MNKKNYTLTAAILIALGSNCVMFTGCQKDYDGQLEIIRNQIKNGDVSVKGLEYKYNLVCEQIEILDEAINKPETEDKDGLKKIKEELEAVREEMKSTIDSLNKAIEGGNAQNSINIKNDIEAATQKYNNRLQEISNEINAIDPVLNILDGRTKRLESQLKSMEEKQIVLEKTIVELRNEIAGMGEDMADQKKKLEEALAKLEEIDSKLTQDIANIQAQVDAVKKATAENAANLEALRQQTIEEIANIRNEVDVKVNDLANEMAGLSDTVVSLGKSFNELNRKYDEMNEKLNDIQDRYNLQIQNIWEAINNLSEGDGQIEELQKALAELQKNLHDLQNTMNMELKKILDTQSLFGQDLQRIDETVNEHTIKLNEMAEKLDALGVLVTNLQKTVSDMEIAFKETIDAIEARLDALEGQTGNPEMLEQMKKDIEKLKGDVEANVKAIEGLKDNQDEQAQKLADLNDFVIKSIAAMDANYKTLTGRVDDMESMIDMLIENINRIDIYIGEVNERVSRNTEDIADLYSRIEEIESGNKYVTVEDLNKILEDLNQKLTDNFADVFSRLNECVTKDEVEELVNSKMQEFEDELNKMNGKIDTLDKEYKALKAEVEKLMNRYQSMELIADYDNGKIKAESLGNNQYSLKLRVEMTPPELIPTVEKLKGIIKLRFKDVILSRGTETVIDDYTINNVTVENGLLNIDATFTAPNPMGESLPYQVAVVLKDDNNYKLSEYRAMALSSNLTLKAGDEVIKYRNGIDSFSDSEIYKRYILDVDKNMGTTVVQIKGTNALFEDELRAFYKQDNGEEKGYDVLYFLRAVYDRNNIPNNELMNYIGIDRYGQISMKEFLSPSNSTTTLEGYRVIVGVQAIENGHKIDNEHYICFQLEKM